MSDFESPADGTAPVPETEALYRYPGPRPFKVGEGELFFGRENEAEELFYSIRQKQLTVLTGNSGVGKSSLLNAKIFPRLKENGYVVLTVRVGSLTLSSGNARSSFGAMEIITDSFAAVCEKEKYLMKVSEDEQDRENLWAYLKTLEIWDGDTLLTPVLVFDQFEEIFTIQSDRIRNEIIEQLGPVASQEIPDEVSARLEKDERPRFSDAPPDVKVIIGLRDEFAGRLQEFKKRIPGILENLFLLKPLSCEQAERAITGPGSPEDDGIHFVLPPFEWHRDEVDVLLRFLALGDASKKKEWEEEGKDAWRDHAEIEPFPLQIICSNAERDLEFTHKAHPELPLEILPGFLGGRDGLNEKVGAYFTEAIESLGSKPSIAAARSLCAEGLLVRSGTFKRRVALPTDHIFKAFGVSERLLKQMEKKRLLRRENIKGQDFWELSHDRLIKPADQSGPRITRETKRRFYLWGSVAAATAGVLVAITVISLLYAKNRKLDFDRLEAEQKKIEAQEARKLAELEKSQAELMASQAELTAKEEYDRVNVDPLREQLEAANAEKDRFEKSLAERDAELTKAKIDLAATNDAVASLNQQVNSQKKQLEELAASSPKPPIPSVPKIDFAALAENRQRLGQLQGATEDLISNNETPEAIRDSSLNAVTAALEQGNALVAEKPKAKTEEDFKNLESESRQWMSETAGAFLAASEWSRNAGDFSGLTEAAENLKKSIEATGKDSAAQNLGVEIVRRIDLELAEINWFQGEVAEYRERIEAISQSDQGLETIYRGVFEFAEILADVRSVKSRTTESGESKFGGYALESTGEALFELNSLIERHAPQIRESDGMLKKAGVESVIEWCIERQEIYMARFEAGQDGGFSEYDPQELESASEGLVFLEEWLGDFYPDGAPRNYQDKLEFENLKLSVRKDGEWESAREKLNQRKFQPDMRMVDSRLLAAEVDRWRGILSPAESENRLASFNAALKILETMKEDGVLPFDHRIWIDEVHIHRGDRISVVTSQSPDATAESDLALALVDIPGTDVRIARFETRLSDYREFVDETSHRSGKSRVFEIDDGTWVQTRSLTANWSDLAEEYDLTEDSPVLGITFEDAKAFCKWFTEEAREEGKIESPAFFRLPKDSEWKRAAVGESSAGGIPVYPWGTMKFPDRENIGNFGGLEMMEKGDFRFPPEDKGNDIRLKAKYRDDYVFLAPVETMNRNWLGLFHMGGNAREWVVGDKTGSPLLRGGSWVDADIESLRLDLPHKTSSSSYIQDSDQGMPFAGFRIVLDPGE